MFQNIDNEGDTNTDSATPSITYYSLLSEPVSPREISQPI